MHETIGSMLSEIAGQGKLFESSRDDIVRQCREVLASIDLSQIEKVYIVGCGDSFYAGNNCKDLFLKYSGLHTEVWQALEFSGYTCEYEVNEKSLVICISNSGKVARTIESAIRAKNKGAVTVGYTGKKDSPLADATDYQVFTTVPQFNPDLVIPGTYSYTASMIALVCMALVLGEKRGVLKETEFDELCEYIKKLGNCVKPTVDACEPIIERYTDMYLGEAGPLQMKMLHFLGSGPNWGNAQYAAEKMLETAAFDAICQGIEEWAHTQFFTTRPGVHTVILAPRGASRRRILEVTQAVTVIDGKKIIIGEDGDEELRRAADIYLPIIGMEDIDESFSPLLYAIPIALLSMNLGRVLNKQAFSFDRPWVMEENLRQIWGSKITLERLA